MKRKKIALIGNPNTGKTTLFNKLTGMNQRVGNWPGVTIEKKVGEFKHNTSHVEVVDLPGIYSLIISGEQDPLDVQITRKYIDDGDYDLIVNIIDATNIARNLYLNMQLIELGLPVVIACNFLDIAEKKGIQIDFEALSEALGIPVVAISATKSQGLIELKNIICDIPEENPIEIPTWLGNLNRDSQNSLVHLTDVLLEHVRNPRKALKLAALAVEGDAISRSYIKNEFQIEVFDAQLHDVHFASSRYKFIHEQMKSICSSKKNLKRKFNITHVIDKFTMNKWLGIPCFLLVMYTMFVFALNVAGTLQDSIDIITQFIFVEKLRELAYLMHIPPLVVNLLTGGFGVGLSTIITFLPVIAGMYFYLTLLEDSGYMARAVFVMDKCMRSLGLSGKSFLPLIIGFGCNVPGILATRTLEEKNERILTIMMSPFMSCGARLAIFTAFVAAFFPGGGGQNIVFLLYFIGIIVALGTGMILKYGILNEVQSPLVLELPPYRLPSLLNASRKTFYRVKSFIKRAIKFIIPICMIIGVLNSLGADGSFTPHQTNPKSILSSIGKSLTPIFKPMGIDEQNWPATVGLFTGTIAKEVVVGTLNTLYDSKIYEDKKINNNYVETKKIIKNEHKEPLNTPSFKKTFSEAFTVFVQHVKNIPWAILHPLKAAAPVDDASFTKSNMSKMVSYFHGQLGAFVYLLFILLYVPCVSTVAVIAQELNWRWATFSVVWSTALAYVLSTIIYQVATFSAHPVYSSVLSISLFAALLAGLIVGLYILSRDKLITTLHGVALPVKMVVQSE